MPSHPSDVPGAFLFLFLETGTIRSPGLSLPLIRMPDGSCRTRQMVAERVTEARVTSVCRYARKCGARKLLVLVRSTGPTTGSLCDTPQADAEARRRFIPFSREIEKSRALWPATAVTLRLSVFQDDRYGVKYNIVLRFDCGDSKIELISQIHERQSRQAKIQGFDL